ncbi:hypothetical protein V0288_11750 [Pannus brasiliensis CCIBt3594]|uniref:PD-(D/E)XK endonuclease-like domain-containing protein n=1 Tax=Pannus brasiliensis CCIBt3594 TaxID=1427578 RepID=A0AAW9QVV9_9CHRO
MKIVHLPAGSKFYETPRGLFPSVTTILQATMPRDQRDRLNRWRERNGSSAELLRQKAAERGTMIHRLLESRFRGEEMECPPDVASFWKEARKILTAIGPVSASEKSLYHPKLQYAGTLDLLADWQGTLTLFDFKTSDREKRSRWLTSARLQIAAYRGAYEYLYGLEIPRGLILVITPDTVQFFSMEREELEEYWREWLIRLEEYRSLDLYHQLFPEITRK